MTYLKKINLYRHGARTVLLGLVLTGVSACVEPQAAVPAPSQVAGKAQLVAGLPKEVQDFVFASAMARQVAKRCPQEFRYNFSLARARESELEAKHIDSEYMRKYRGNPSAALDVSELERLARAYSAKRKIVFGQDATWCPAGQAEVAEKTDIGKYLIVN